MTGLGALRVRLELAKEGTADMSVVQRPHVLPV